MDMRKDNMTPPKCMSWDDIKLSTKKKLLSNRKKYQRRSINKSNICNTTTPTNAININLTSHYAGAGRNLYQFQENEIENIPPKDHTTDVTVFNFDGVNLPKYYKTTFNSPKVISADAEKSVCNIADVATTIYPKYVCSLRLSPILLFINSGFLFF